MIFPVTIVKIKIPQTIDILKVILLKIPTVIFYRNGKDNPQIHIGLQRELNSQNIIKRESKVGGLMILNCKTYFKVTVN